MQPFDWLEKLDASEICYSCHPLFQSNWIISVRTCPATLLVIVIKSHIDCTDKTPLCSCNYCGRPIATPWVQIVNCTFLHKKTLAGSNVKFVSFSFKGIKYCSSHMSETKIVMGSHYEKVLVLSVTTWMEENPLNPTSESADEQKM